MIGWDPTFGYGGRTKYWGIQLGDVFLNTVTGKRFVVKKIGDGLSAIDEDGVAHEYADLRLIERRF